MRKNDYHSTGSFTETVKYSMLIDPLKSRFKCYEMQFYSIYNTPGLDNILTSKDKSTRANLSGM